MTVSTVGKFPVYTSGQTLTADDLNGERDHLAGRDRLLGRTVGFGVAAGLEGQVTTGGTRLQISPGLALDQRGEAIMLTAEQAASIGVIPLEPSVATAAATYGFVSGTEGYSVVLQAHVTEGPAQHTCSAQGCEGHARLDTLASELVVVRGRLTMSTTDFTQEELLKDFTPLTFATTGAVMGGFGALRDKIAGRVGTSLSATALARLRGLTLDGILALQQYKAAFLNQVYVAALDLLRFRSLMSETVLRDTPTPGVVLGWVHQAGGAWVWDCSYRHHWEPPTGLTQAFFGGSCQKPDQLYVDRLENLIMSYNPPTPPPPADPPGTLDPDKVHICKARRCLIYPFPGRKLHEEWRDKYAHPGRQEFIDPLWDPNPEQLNVDIFEDVYADLTHSGHVELSQVFGAGADQVKAELDRKIAAAGITPHTTVVTLDQAKGTPGLTFASGVSPDDQALLVKDDQGKLVGVGRVPAALSLQQVGTGLPAAQSQARAAYDATTGFATQLNGFDQTLKLIQVGIGNVQTAQTGLEHAFETMPTNVESQVHELLSLYQLQVTHEIQGQVEETLKNVTDQVKATHEATLGLLEWQSTAKKEIDRNTVRVDTVYTRTAVPELGVTRPEIGRSTLDVLRSVRTALETAAADDQREGIRPQLAAADDGIARLEASLSTGGSPLADSPQTLTTVLTSLADGLAGVGANAAQVRAIRTRTDALGKLLQP